MVNKVVFIQRVADKDSSTVKHVRQTIVNNQYNSIESAIAIKMLYIDASTC